MDAIWSLIGQVGVFVLSLVISDIAKRTELQANFTAFINNRQVRADETVELKNNLDAQSADLDQVQKDLEAKAKEGLNNGTPPVTNSQPSKKISGPEGDSGQPS